MVNINLIIPRLLKVAPAQKLAANKAIQKTKRNEGPCLHLFLWQIWLACSVA